jgi:uncharacterized membrane protein required for colicin V production
MRIWFDLLMLLLIFGAMLLGFSQGLVRQLFNVAGIYFGLVVASYANPTMTRFATRLLGETESFTREAFIFFLVFAAVWALFNLGAYISFRSAPKFFPATVDSLLGMLLGIFTGSLVALVVVLLLNYTTQVPWPGNNDLREGISLAIETSALRPLIATMIPTLVNLLEPWIPRGLPTFFSIGI